MKNATGGEGAAAEDEVAECRSFALSDEDDATKAPGVVDASALICTLRRARVAATVALWEATGDAGDDDEEDAPGVKWAGEKAGGAEDIERGCVA